MGSFFIGIDFGTVHTKVCVREDVADRPAAVCVNPHGTGTAAYLLRSAPAGWSDRLAPKVVLCGQTEIDCGLEHRAITAATRAVAIGVRAAIAQVERDQPGPHSFILQLGLPTEHGVMVEGARYRYFLAADAALTEVGDSRVKFCNELLDERLATLALLDKAKLQLGNEPVLVVDAGGWTTHVSLLRWVANPARVSIHGDSTATHGVQPVVRKIGEALRVDDDAAADVLDHVVGALYGNALHDEVTLANALQLAPGANAAYARLHGRSSTEADREFGAVIDALGAFVAHPRLHAAWHQAWAGGWEASPGGAHYRPYRLLLAGGAARIGRTVRTLKTGPLAAQLRRWQAETSIPFTGTVYPELDPRFWTFDPAPPPEVIPYLFAAGGYTHPWVDWPTQMKRTVLTVEARPQSLRACHCTGTSESCPDCGGTGWLKPGRWVTSVRNSATAVKVLGQRVGAAPTEELCELCLAIVHSSRRLEHFTTAHQCPVCRLAYPDLAMHRPAHPVIPRQQRPVTSRIRRSPVPPPRNSANRPQASNGAAAKSAAKAQPQLKAQPQAASPRRHIARVVAVAPTRTTAASTRPRRNSTRIDPAKPLKHRPFDKLKPPTR